MPDSTKKTVSASQVPAILNLSPYSTRFNMHHHFRGTFNDEAVEDERMGIGKRLEPAILAMAAEELRCDVLRHDQADYLRHPTAPLGCTPDGWAIDPQRGFGFIEAKNVDFFRWKDTWGDTTAPAHIEIQHQIQLAIPHPQLGLPKWGAIACLVGGNDFRLYPRDPIPEVHARCAEEATAFLAEVEEGREPDVFGTAIELPALAAAYPFADKDTILDEGDFTLEESIRIARMIDDYSLAKDRESYSKKEADELKAKLLAAAGEAGLLMIHGRNLKISKSQIAGRTQVVKPYTMVRMTASLQSFPADLDKLAPAAADDGYDVPLDILV